MTDDVEEAADFLKKAEEGRTWQKTQGFPQIAQEQQVTAEGTRYGVRPTVTPIQNFDNDTYDGGSGATPHARPISTDTCSAGPMLPPRTR